MGRTYTDITNVWGSDFQELSFEPGSLRIESGDVGDMRGFTFSKIFNVNGAGFIALTLTVPKKGHVMCIVIDNVWCYFEVNSVRIERVGSPMPDGYYQVKATFNLTLFKLADQKVDPWDLPAYNYRCSSSGVEESVTNFFAASSDPLNSSGVVGVQMPFVNTAGVPLQATRTRSLVAVSFSYNLRPENFDVNAIWTYAGCVNSSAVTICGVTYAPFYVRLESISYEYCSDEDQNGNKTYYWKCDVNLVADPRGYGKSYLNVGTHVIYTDNQGNTTLQRIWSWQDDNGNTVYGAYPLYAENGMTNGEEVSENMFLNPQGTGLSPFSNGRQTPTYRQGCIHAIADLNNLHFPQDLPWNVEDSEDEEE